MTNRNLPKLTQSPPLVSPSRPMLSMSAPLSMVTLTFVLSLFLPTLGSLSWFQKSPSPSSTHPQISLGIGIARAQAENLAGDSSASSPTSLSLGSTGPTNLFKADVHKDLEALGSIFRNHYAPLEWKQKNFNYSLEVELAKAHAAVDNLNSSDLRDYQKIASQLLFSVRDYHVSIGFLSTESSSLPFSVLTIDGHTYIAWINSSVLNYTNFPFSAGDEILSWNGHPVAEERAQVLKEVGNNTKETDEALADLFLTVRMGRRAMTVPKGPVTLKIQKTGWDTQTVQVIWNYKEEKFQAGPLKPNLSFPLGAGGRGEVEASNLQPPSETHIYSQSSPYAHLFSAPVIARDSTIESSGNLTKSSPTKFSQPENLKKILTILQKQTSPYMVLPIWPTTQPYGSPFSFSLSSSTSALSDGSSRFSSPVSPDSSSSHRQDHSIEENPFSLGAKKSFLPSLGPGTELWTSEESNIFQAYIYRDDQGAQKSTIGYIRIPSYTPENPLAAVMEFKKLITLYNSFTDALVIDQLNNPGGSIFYLYALASMLAPDGLAAPRQRIILNAEDVIGAQMVLEMIDRISEAGDNLLFESDLDGYPLNSQSLDFMKSFLSFLVQQWNLGKKLTDPHFVYAVDRIQPQMGVTYKKPIFVLTNSLDFSGGDFFPAILQDNERAKIIGTRTAGAGGYVRGIMPLNNLAIEFVSFTGSIAERIDQNPIENLGVTPDYLLQVTPNDLKGSFYEYRTRVNEIIRNELFPPTPMTPPPTESPSAPLPTSTHTQPDAGTPSSDAPSSESDTPAPSAPSPQTDY